MVWILGRIYCTGTPADYAAVHALQDEFSLVPLSSYGKPYTPPAGQVDSNVDMKAGIRDQVDHMDVVAYFTYLAQLMKTSPPTAEDAPMVANLAKIGLLPGQDFDPSKLVAFDKEALKIVPKLAQVKIMEHFKQLEPINGWMFTTKTGIYGTDYLQRALITAIGLGANRPQDAIYPTGEKDAASKRYVIHFDKGQMPPVDVFWSITMYDASYFFVPNSLNRYTLSQRNTSQADWDREQSQQNTRPGQAQERAKSVNMLYCEQGIELFAPFEGDRSDVSWAARIMLHWANLDEEREPSFRIVCSNYSDRPQYGLHNWSSPNLLWEMLRRRRVKLSATQLLSRNRSEALIDKDNHACDGNKYVIMTRPEPTMKTRRELALERTKPLAEAGDLTSANVRYLQLMDDDVDYWPQPVVRHGRVNGSYRRSR